MAIKQRPDSPTNNFATFNELHTNGTLTEGNLEHTSTSTYAAATSNFLIPSSVPIYFEIYVKSVNFTNIGLMRGAGNIYTNMYVGYDPNQVYYGISYRENGDIYIDTQGAGTASSEINGSATSYTTGDIIGVFVDISSNLLKFYKSGSLEFTVSNLQNYNWYAAASSYSSSVNIANFGQDPTFGGNKNTPATVNINGTNVTGPFAPSGDAEGTAGLFYYPPPAGALALCTANLPEMTPDVDDDVPQDYFKAVLYTGNDGTQSITGVGFQPDLVWVKERTSNSSHQLHDSVRGAGRALITNVDNDESDYTSTYLNLFTSDGFRVGSSGAVNSSTDTYVAWCWEAGGAPTADNSNTSGSMTANSVSLNGTLQSSYTPSGSPTIYPKRMSINTDAGFSIVSYTGTLTTGSGQTISHGLTTTPDLIIIKNRTSNTTNFVVWSSAYGTNEILYLNTTDSIVPVSANRFGGASSTTFSVGYYYVTGYLNDEYIAYCWHSVEGFSKFGSYTGNGSADGPFVYCGFRPAFVMCKCSSDTTTTHTSWAMYDNARDSSNVMNKVLYANDGTHEGFRGDGSTTATDIYIDFLSNGFKVRSTKEEVNDDGETYIFMAFAEQPFNYANAR